MVRFGNLFSEKLAGAPSVPVAAWFLVLMLYLAVAGYARLERCPALRWLAGVIVPAGMWLAATMPRMGAFDSRYFMPLCPLVAVAAALMLRRFGQAFGLSAEQAGRLLILWAVWNAVLAVDWRRNPFIMPQTAATKTLIAEMEGKRAAVFYKHDRSFGLYAPALAYGNSEAVYLSKDMCPEALPDGTDLALFINQAYIKENRRRTLCPQWEGKLDYQGTALFWGIYFDWYKLRRARSA